MSSNQSSLIPARKHRKLLKDGSGEEVWPESVETLFIQGLEAYWDSPYASCSATGGRSRWRNQFLVEHLAKHGIIRTKKQVASHLQVLRGMWKGQKEYHLVAGVDEHYQMKSEDESADDSEFSSPASMASFNASLPDSPYSAPTTVDSSPAFNTNVKMEDSHDMFHGLSQSMSTYTLPQAPVALQPNSLANLPTEPRRVISFTLHSGTSSPFRIYVDQLLPPPPPPERLTPAVVKILLSPNHSRFEVEVEVSKMCNFGFSLVKSYRRSHKVDEVTNGMEIERITLGRPLFKAGIVSLGESTSITHEFVFNEEILMYLVYEINFAPNADPFKLERWQRYGAGKIAKSLDNAFSGKSPESVPSSTSTHAMSDPMCQPRSRTGPTKPVSNPSYSISPSFSHPTMNSLSPSASYTSFSPAYSSMSAPHLAMSASASMYTTMPSISYSPSWPVSPSTSSYAPASPACSISPQTSPIHPSFPSLPYTPRPSMPSSSSMGSFHAPLGTGASLSMAPPVFDAGDVFGNGMQHH